MCVFGSTNVDVNRYYPFLKQCLDAFERPLTIVTSTTRGWDYMGRKYADMHDGVNKKVIKADMTLGWEKGVKNCNEEMASLVEFGITGENPSTRGTLHMIETLQQLGKQIIYITVRES